MGRVVRLGNRHPDSHHATKVRLSGMVVETGRWADMDMDMDKGRDRVLVDNKGKDNPLIAGMKQNQVRIPCCMPPMTRLMISAYAKM
ncbi:hypothetical protein [Paenibacillus sp. JNUCC31]|uniref:hypothetical protein n=1 Tax=Paenibacillus sp. JNUCC-31 TaxID=2777983 RepID=UPI001E4B8FAA|nr:hypothetical protein [Paenibacillus sp. JNUCC-31]